MKEIELTVMNHAPNTAQILGPWLAQFEKEFDAHVNLRVLDWNTGRAEITSTALYRRGPDVSEVGSTRIHDLVAMDALRPFSPAEASQIGQADDYIAAAWEAACLGENYTRWAIPWMSEVYAIYYRRDMLQRTGIQEADGFKTPAAMDQTAKRLNASGVPVPIGLPLQSGPITNLHCLATWVWAAGGEFCRSDGRVLFDQPAALQGIRAYLGLLRHMSAEARQLVVGQGSRALFLDGRAATILTTPSIIARLRSSPPDIANNWGIAPLPGPSIVGGTGLVIWKHTRQEALALNLVQFLAAADTQMSCTRALNSLSPRRAVTYSAEFLQDPPLHVLAEVARTGRTYAAVRLWGLIEDRLSQTILQIWNALVNDPELDLDAMTGKQLGYLCKQLNVSLA